MTALAIATDIPSQIVTVEQLHSWSGLLLANINPALTAIEGAGYSERTSQASIYYIQADNRYRLISRQSIAFSPNYLAGGSKLWMFAQDLSATAIPAVFRTN
jgi:hypothetical protein